jgi:MFS family permease
MSSLLVVWFGFGQSDLQQMKLVVLTVGLFTNAAIVGLYSIFAQAFPTHVRATGTGLAIGAGRGFSWLAPILAGFLFQWGFGLQGVAMLMAVGSLLAAVCLWQLRFQEDAAIKA